VTITVIIDGKEQKVEKGTHLLEAARAAGIDIPAFCHHEALEPYGSCRLCLVEISKGDWTKITTSCNYPCLRDGEVVSTSSPRVLRARKVVMELLLARCPDSQPVKEMARKIGVTESRFPSIIPSHIASDEDALANCILCGLCVRACDEAIGASAISFTDRGPNRRVAAPFYVDSKACTGCGACAAVCPTGVITVQDSAEGIRRLPFLNMEVPLRLCGSCGQHFAPEGQLGGVKAKAPQVGQHLDICTDCRRKESGLQSARFQAVAR